MEFKNLIYSVDSNIAEVVINRPKKLNALNLDTLDELEKVVQVIKNDKNVFVVIITGSGEKAFVAGADILELSKCTSETGKSFSEKGQRIFNELENLRKPVIAAINGYALGGGCELALACHIRVASENAKFGLPEVGLGVIPGYGGTQRFARLVNTGLASEYILTGDMINAEEAKKIGLVNKVFLKDNLISETKKIAFKITKKSQVAVSCALSSIQSANNSNQIEGLILESDLFAKCCGSKDFREGTAAFLEKREPNF